MFLTYNELREERDKLLEFATQVYNLVDMAPVSTGVCCCGDDMGGHADPMSSGHSPVDEWDYHSRLVLDKAPEVVLNELRTSREDFV